MQTPFMSSVPAALLWTHAAYWAIAVITVWLVRRLRVQVERVASELEAKTRSAASGEVETR